MRILIRAPNWIGDQVLALPFYYYLRKAHPNAHITIVCVSWVADLQFHNLVNDVFILPTSRESSLLSRFRTLERGIGLFGRHKKEGFDLGISLPNSFSAAWFLYRGGARARRGYKVDARSFLLNEPLEWDPSPDRHRAQAYTDLLPENARPGRKATDFWGKRVDPEGELGGTDSHLIPPEWPRFEFERAWPETDWMEPPQADYWIMAPGSKAFSRRWPLEKYVSFALRVVEETGWKVVVVGGKDEVELGSHIKRHLQDHCIDRTDHGSITALAPVFEGAKFTISNESGLAHVAALCGSNVQIVCGAADPRRTQPIGPGKVQVSVNLVECWPCEKNFCRLDPDDQILCLKGIQPESVWEEIKRGIGNSQAQATR